MEAFAIRNKATGEWWTTPTRKCVWCLIGEAKNAFYNRFQRSINNQTEYEIVRLVPEERN